MYLSNNIIIMSQYVKIIDGNLLEAKEKYLAHQCNCATIKSAHLAKSVFDKYPYANTYKSRTYDKSTRSIPGTIDVLGNGSDQRFVINMYAQYYPSKAKYANDSYALRMGWFKQCLDEIAKIDSIKDLALPFNCGCGSAGGDWNQYYSEICNFANKYKINVVLYRLNV